VPQQMFQDGRLVIETIHDLFPWLRHLFADGGLRRCDASPRPCQTWSVDCRNPQSRFFGFDSFEGLPENFAAESTCTAGVLSGLAALALIEPSAERPEPITRDGRARALELR
jgi:hypothetical protein